MDYTLDDLWLGTEASHQVYDLAKTKLAASDVSTLGDGLPSLVTQHGDVAVVRIAGSLVSGEAGFLQYFGVTGYEDIANALLAATGNPEIKSIVLDVASGGGQVNGVQQLADFITNVDQVKPVVAYTGENMMSAAYWLSSAARSVVSASTGETGSIGVLQIHAEKSKQLAADGVVVNVIRAGKFKALANPYEPLSDAGRAAMQEKVDAVHAIFKDHVAASRKMSSSQVNKIGQGQTYLGDQALAAGLVDQVGNLSDAMMLARKCAPKSANVKGSLTSSVDSRRMGADNSANSGTNDMNLTPAQLAAVAAGASVEEALKIVASDPVADAAAAEAAAAAQLAADAATAAAKLAADAALAAAAAPKPDLQAYLTEQLAAANTHLVDAKVQIAQLTAQVNEAKSSHDGLLAIARDSVGKMSIALGGTAQAGQSLTATELLAEHARIADVFKTKFKVGGVAATKPEAEQKPAAVVQQNAMFKFLSATVPTK